MKCNRMFDKIKHYMLRLRLFMTGWREAYIIGVELALKTRGLNGAKVYSKSPFIQVLYKNKTVIFDNAMRCDTWFWGEEPEESFDDYAYRKLEALL